MRRTPCKVVHYCPLIDEDKVEKPMSYSVKIASEPVVTERFKQALETDYVVIGGDNAKKRGKLSPGPLLPITPTFLSANFDSIGPLRRIDHASCVAIIPLAGLLGEATEHIAEHAGEGIGGLLNALFVALLLVFLSEVIAPHPMALVHRRGEVLAVIWFIGAQLSAAYLILAVAFYFMPG
jgi:hypothetical protein